jgi:hypothetical protein
MEAFVAAYGTQGFEPCEDGEFQPGIEKLALYGTLDSPPIPTHAALQLESGEWTSKLGHCEDISHASVDSLHGPCYGRVICFLSRPRRTT